MGPNTKLVASAIFDVVRHTIGLLLAALFAWVAIIAGTVALAQVTPKPLMMGTVFPIVEHVWPTKVAGPPQWAGFFAAPSEQMWVFAGGLGVTLVCAAVAIVLVFLFVRYISTKPAPVYTPASRYNAMVGGRPTLNHGYNFAPSVPPPLPVERTTAPYGWGASDGYDSGQSYAPPAYRQDDTIPPLGGQQHDVSRPLRGNERFGRGKRGLDGDEAPKRLTCGEIIDEADKVVAALRPFVDQRMEQRYGTRSLARQRMEKIWQEKLDAKFQPKDGEELDLRQLQVIVIGEIDGVFRFLATDTINDLNKLVHMRNKAAHSKPINTQEEAVVLEIVRRLLGVLSAYDPHAEDTSL